jgi:hypothetical protein
MFIPDPDFFLILDPAGSGQEITRQGKGREERRKGEGVYSVHNRLNKNF